MRGLLSLLFSVFLMVGYVYAETRNLCESVALLNSTSTSVMFSYTDICKDDELIFHIPKGTTQFIVYFENNPGYTGYSCIGPNLYAVFSDNASVSLDTGSAVEFTPSNMVDLSYSSGAGWSGPSGWNLDTTWYMEPETGSSLAIYVDADNNGTDKEYFLKIKPQTHIDLITINISVNGTNFDPGECSGTETPDNNTKSFGCGPENYPDECEEYNGTESAVNLGGSHGTYGSGGTSSAGGSTTGGGTTTVEECHYEMVCEPCAAECTFSRCYYKRVCTTREVTTPPTTTTCTACSGSRVRPPFNLKTTTSQQPTASSVLPFWAQALSGGFRKFQGGSSSTTTTSQSSQSGQAVKPSISGKMELACDAACIADNSKPKFYANDVQFSLSERIPVYVYVPEYATSVDVYLGVVNPVGDLWIVKMSGNTATAYKYNGILTPYAINISSSIYEWFYLDEVMPIQSGHYTLYMLVVPHGEDLNNLNNYQLTWYEFDVVSP